MTNLAKYKHSGKITGLKNKGHVKNSIPIPLVTQITKKQEYMHSNFLNELVIDYANLDNNYDRLFEETQIATASILSDEFIKPEFDLNMLKVYFDNDGWSAVEELHKVKVRSCTCKKCTSICTESFITCTFCNTRIHYDCDSVNFYYRSGKGKQFKCSLCKSIKK